MVGGSLSVLRLTTDERLSHQARLKRAIRDGQLELVGWCARENGSRFRHRLIYVPQSKSGARRTGFDVLLQDLTRQEEVENIRRRLSAVLETAVDPIITIDERGVIDWINPATAHVFGFTEAELIGKNVRLLMPRPYRSEHDEYLRNYLRTGEAKIIGIGREVTAMRKDGTTFPARLAVSEMRLGEKRLFTGIIHDLSAQRRLERQIVEASTNEQRRIAQDLHDGLCQELVGIALGADTIARRIAGTSRSQADAVDRLAASVREVTMQARQLSHGLNPVNLSAGGLVNALQSLAERISHSLKLDCKLIWDGVAEVHDDSSATQLYRIAQESINNAIRHGKASRIDIRLSVEGNTLKLSILDNGIGFSPRQAALLHPHTAGKVDNQPVVGIGLATMRYRSNMIGGILDIRSRRTRGTAVTVTVRERTTSSKGKSRPKYHKS